MLKITIAIITHFKYLSSFVHTFALYKIEEHAKPQTNELVKNTQLNHMYSLNTTLKPSDTINTYKETVSAKFLY